MYPSFYYFLLESTFLIKTGIETKMADYPDCDEHVLCGDEWKVEAEAVIHDVGDNVHDIRIADVVVGDQQVYINLTTKEMCCYCIELTAQGFRVVGNQYNHIDISTGEYYETPYALLNKLSPLYMQAFGNSLVSKLEVLCSSQVHNTEEEG